MDVVEIEETIIGALLNECHIHEGVLSRICPEYFTDPELGSIFQAMFRLKKFSIVDIVKELNLGFSGSFRLRSMYNNAASTANLLAWCDIMKEKAVQRGLRSCAKQYGSQLDVALYFEETAEELRNSGVTKAYLLDVMVTSAKSLYELMLEAPS